MLRASERKGESKRQVQFVGICADAKRLGVTREHLYRVLMGQRRSRKLLRRYQELKGRAGEPGTGAG